jgi:hypothetical protein
MPTKADQASTLQPKHIADRVRRVTAQASSYEDFGRRFIRSALLEAANVFETGKHKDNRVELTVKVNVKFTLPRREAPATSFIDPDSIDLCYELCAGGDGGRGGFWACYRNCQTSRQNADDPALDPGNLPSEARLLCDHLFQLAMQGNHFALRQFLASGCVAHAQIMSALEPLVAAQRQAVE